MIIKSRSKINISLDVLKKRNDGYHEVSMIMQTLDLCDDITVKKIEKDIIISSNLDYLPTDNTNIAYKAAHLFLDSNNITDSGVSIDIYKRIPVAAGMAGGSSNAAAVLRAMNEIFETGMSTKELMILGKKLGADVPFCITGGTMLAEGTGTTLTRLNPLYNCDVLICKPPFSVSTEYIYFKIKADKIVRRPDTKGLLTAIENHNYIEMNRRMYNVMEDITTQMHREIADIKKVMLFHGADVSMMTGSGPTVFGFFSDNNIHKAFKELAKIYKEIHICRISNEFYE